VREPISRTASNFHYSIDSNLRREKALKVLENRRLDRCGCYNMSYSSCVVSASKYNCPKNQLLMSGMLSYFLTTEEGKLYEEERCHSPSYFLKLAIQRIEKEYVVVGVLEYLAETLYVYEKLLPTFFAHASEVEIEKVSKRSTTWHETVSREASDILRSNQCNMAEFMLYSYLVKDLLNKYNNLKTAYDSQI